MTRLSDNVVTQTVTTEKNMRGFSMWSNISVGTQADLIGIKPTYKLGRYPLKIICPDCRMLVVSRVRIVSKNCSMDSLVLWKKTTQHLCGQCKQYLGSGEVLAWTPVLIIIGLFSIIWFVIWRIIIGDPNGI